MSSRATVFKQADVTRAVKGVQNAGLEVARVQVDPGGVIVVVAGKADGGSSNSMDQLTEDFE